jgi:hypothetical protein
MYIKFWLESQREIHLGDLEVDRLIIPRILREPGNGSMDWTELAGSSEHGHEPMDPVTAEDLLSSCLITNFSKKMV